MKPLHLEGANQIIITSTIIMTVKTSAEVITAFQLILLSLLFIQSVRLVAHLSFVS